MTNTIIPMNFDGEPVRVVTIDGDPWFVGKDVAERLGYANASDAMNKHCRGVAKRYPITDALGREQEARVLAESDVLRLIVNSRLPAAERFERWVFDEVLPTIRKTGGYGTPRDPLELLSDPAVVRHLLLTYSGKVLNLEAEVGELRPKADAIDRLSGADGSLCITDAAKALKVRPKDLFGYLRQHGWIYKRTGSAHDVAYAERLAAGLLEHKVTTVSRSDGSEKITEQVRVTARGLAKLAEVMQPAERELV